MSIRYKLLGYVCKGFPQGPPTASFSSSRVSIWQYICCQVIWNEQRDKIFIRCLFELIFKILETKPSLVNGQGEKTMNVNTIVKFASSTSLFASKSALNSHHCDECSSAESSDTQQQWQMHGMRTDIVSRRLRRRSKHTKLCKQRINNEKRNVITMFSRKWFIMSHGVCLFVCVLCSSVYLRRRWTFRLLSVLPKGHLLTTVGFEVNDVDLFVTFFYCIATRHSWSLAVGNSQTHATRWPSG